MTQVSTGSIVERFQNALNAVESFQDSVSSSLHVGRPKSVSFAPNPIVQQPTILNGPTPQKASGLSPPNVNSSLQPPVNAATPLASKAVMAASPTQQVGETTTLSQRFPQWSIILIAIAIASLAFMLRKKVSALYGQFMGKQDSNEIGSQQDTELENERSRNLQMLQSMGLSPAQAYGASNTLDTTKFRLTPNEGGYTGATGTMTPQAGSFAFQQQAMQQQYSPEFYEAMDDAPEFDAVALQKAQFAQMIVQKGKGSQRGGPKGSAKGNKVKGKGKMNKPPTTVKQQGPSASQQIVAQPDDVDDYYHDSQNATPREGSPEFFSEDQNFLPI